MQFYQNRQSSLLSKSGNTASLKYANNIIISKPVAPPVDNISTSNTYNPKQINPIRHYRKQLSTTNSSRSQQIISQINQPGKIVTRNNTDDCDTCSNDNNTVFIKEKIYPNNEPTQCVDNCVGYQSQDPKLWKYNCCSKENNVIKTASTNLSKSYSTSNSEFLKRRCKTHRQNIYSNNNSCSTDCNNNYYCNNTNVKPTGNINNEIGGDYVSAYIYKNGYRDIKNGIINKNNTELCCDDSKVNYKNVNDICKFKQFNNMHSLKLVKLCS